MKKHIRRSFGSDFSRNAREGHPKNLDDKVPNEKPIPLCEFNSYCGLRKARGRGNCFEVETKDCRTYKFYKRYGEDYNQLGVGS